MSVYSLDSLENEVVRIPKAQGASRDGIEEQKSANETADKDQESKNKRLKSAKNAIIAPAEDVESRQYPGMVVAAPAASSTRMENSDGIGRKKEIPVGGAGGPQQRAFRRSSARLTSASGDKKLGNVLRPVTSCSSTTPLGLPGKNKRPASYLELYCRRFSGKKMCQSPEGSRLSICGDSSDERRQGLLEAMEEAGSSSPGSQAPGDDESELSFYRRLLISGRSAAAGDHLHSTTVDEYNDRLRRTFQRLRLDDQSKTLRLYTVQDYQNMKLTSLNLDRSLGPDMELVNAKKESLMRRRSYGNAVSELNRRRISSAIQKSKSVSKEEGSTTTAKRHEEKTTTSRNHQPRERPKTTTTLSITHKRYRQTSPTTTTAKTRTARLPVAGKSRSVPPPITTAAAPVTRKQHRTASNPEVFVDKLSLQALKARHFNERQMMDQIIRQSMLA